MKKVLVADTLPQGMQDELGALIRAMEARYGRDAVTVGVHIENLSTLVSMVGSHDMAEADRANAIRAASRICNEVLCALGEALNVSQESAFAVASALQEHSRHINAEMLGEQPLPATVTAEADAVIAKARILH